MQERGPLVSSLTARRLLTVAVAAVVVAVDQVTKTWAEHQLPRHVIWTLWFYPTLNRGAAFGLGQGVTPIVETAVVLLVAALIVFGRRASRAASIPVSIGLGLLVGGAIGNLVDRVIRDNDRAVIDFIDAVRVGHHDLWPTFNVADASIVVGAIVLALAFAYRRSSHPTQAPTS
ncbi:MAG: signal peptidase II [Acidimicrobiaceae bacterium]|nr:signal peptidase II [Acidimicrobiaceae bacterium]